DDAMKKVSSLKPRFEALGVELCFEVTERQFLDQRVASQLSSVRQLGVEVAIDDFGTGQTALSVLQTISFDYLKIDKSFVDTIGVDSVNHHVLDAIIDLAHRLEVKIVAEGVEDNTQTGYLKERNCHYLQGYNFFKPLSLDDLAASFVVKQPVELASNESLEEVG
ncbi:EAL domain-containing protein, partial [Photobacterium sp. OFAV2-7]|uniref:EAL domain-containing protein n=1 Tax=Photobacterium sp. OFAV2-7 TaxID=2917748 RepID=UPI001EF4EC5D